MTYLNFILTEKCFLKCRKVWKIIPKQRNSEKKNIVAFGETFYTPGKVSETGLAE
jgi:hypothetical protein